MLEVYWQQWEIECGYGELKQYQLQDKPTLRSKKADGVYQEIEGLLTSCNIVRLEMAAIAKQHKVDALRISFVNALFLITDEFIWSNTRSPGVKPQRQWQEADIAKEAREAFIPESYSKKASQTSK